MIVNEHRDGFTALWNGEWWSVRRHREGFVRLMIIEFDGSLFERTGIVGEWKEERAWSEIRQELLDRLPELILMSRL